MFATQRLAASATGVCWAGAWQMTGIDRDSFPHGTRPARRASTRTRVGTGLARHDEHRLGLVPHGTRLTPTGIPHDGRSDSSGTTGTPHDRRADSSGITGTPHNGRSDSFGTTGTRHDERSDSSGPCPAWASWIAGFPAHRYP